MTDRTDRAINAIKKQQFEPKTPIANEMFLPNVSNVHDYARKDRPDSRFTDGSVIFSNIDGVLTQNNANFFWDETNEALLLGTTIGGIGNRLLVQGGNFKVKSPAGENRVIIQGAETDTANARIRIFDGSAVQQVELSADSAIDSYFAVSKLGIGTKVPGVDLHVISDSVPVIAAEDSRNSVRTVISSDETFGLMGTLTDHLLLFVVNSAAKAAITTAGFFGIANTTPVCTLDVNGGFATNVVTKTANYTATTSDDLILCGPGNETFTVTLPAASGVSGLILTIKNIGTGTITVDGNSAETIDGSATKVISTQYDSITIQCDGSNWHIK